LLAGAAIAGTALAGTLAVKGVAVGVGAIIEQRAREARRRAEEERARMAEWRAFEQRQQQAMVEAQARHEAIAQMQQRLLAVQLHEPDEVAVPAPSGTRRAQGYVSPQPRIAAQRAAIAAALTEIAAALDAVPENLRRHDASPIPSLQQQVGRYRRRLETDREPLDPSRIQVLRQTAQQSIAAFLERLAAERDEQGRRIERAEAALQLLLVLEQLPQSSPEPLSLARQALLTTLARDDISAEALTRIEQQLQTASQQAAERLATTAVRPALAESLLRHLSAMGYQVLETFPDGLAEAEAEQTATARVRIPGGEQVAIQLDADARLRFNLLHERAELGSTPLSREEVDHLRAQEKRWCHDLKDLIARLVADGFDSEIQLEQTCSQIRCTTLPTAVVERFTEDEDAFDDEAAYEEQEARRRKQRQAAKPKQRKLT
jgi:hypothetical protein